MWQDVEGRIDENDMERHVPIRCSFLDIMKRTNIKPTHAEKKMVSMEFGRGDRIGRRIENSGQTFYLPTKWTTLTESLGLNPRVWQYKNGKKDGGRARTLSAEWLFSSSDCISTTIESEHVDFHREVTRVFHREVTHL